MVEKASKHSAMKYHKEALEEACSFIQRRKQPTVTVTSQLDAKRAENIARNRQILECIIHCILYCGRQCIPLRGDVEVVNSVGNPGNFLAGLKLISKYNNVLQEHLLSPALRNAKMTSPQIQNEF